MAAAVPAGATEEPVEPPAAETELVGAAAVRGVVRSGTVAVPGVAVQAFKNGVLARAATTAADGTFALTGLVGGTYVLVADKWGVVRTQQSINVPTGTTVRNVVIQVVMAGALSGKVTNGSGLPISATVTVRSYSTGQITRTVTSAAATGLWKMADLTPGGYIVVVSKAGFATEWWNNSLVPALSRPIAVATGQTVGNVDTQLGPLTGFIAGSLSTSTNQPANGSVKLYRAGAASNFVGSFPVVNGAWATGPLSPGRYLVLFTAPGETSEWWVNGDFMDQATPITVGTTGVLGINAQLERRVSVTGQVRDPNGRPAPSNSLAVFYWKGTNRVAAIGVTGSDGSYTATGLRVGEYEIEARPPSGSTYRSSDRRWVFVIGGRIYGALDLMHAPGVSGLVVKVESDSRSAVITGSATLFKIEASGLTERTTVPLASGIATFADLPLGRYSYRLSARVDGGPEITQWSGEAAIQSQALPVVLDGAFPYAARRVAAVGESTSWVQLDLRAAGVSGALGNVAVYPRGSTAFLTVFTGIRAGTIEALPLAPGLYDLRFISNVPGLSGSWYLGASTQVTATPVTFVPGFATRLTWTVG